MVGIFFILRMTLRRFGFPDKLFINILLEMCEQIPSSSRLWGRTNIFFSESAIDSSLLGPPLFLKKLRTPGFSWLHELMTSKPLLSDTSSSQTMTSMSFPRTKSTASFVLSVMLTDQELLMTGMFLLYPFPCDLSFNTNNIFVISFGDLPFMT